jgi:hypothetical protein
MQHGQSPNNDTRHFATAQLNNAVLHILNKSLAPSTAACYKNAMQRYKCFHDMYYDNSPLFPISHSQLAQFIAFCHHRQLKASTITSYISALGYMHKMSNLKSPSDSIIIKKMMHGIRRQVSPDKRQPFTLADLTKLLNALKIVVKDKYTRILVKSMFLTAFFGLLRAGELARSPTGINNVLCRQDISFQYHESHVSAITMTLRHFKHSLGQKSVIPLSRQNFSGLCPVKALLRYLRLAPTSKGPLFRDIYGCGITTSFFRQTLRNCVTYCNLDPSIYTAHSFRIGGATFAHQCHMSTAQIKQLGRWKSSAYLKYIRTLPIPVTSCQLNKT